MPSISNVSLQTSNSCANLKGVISATVTSNDPLGNEFVSVSITDEDGNTVGTSSYLQRQSSITVNNLPNNLYIVTAYGSLKPDFEVTKNINITCTPTSNITITPNLSTVDTIKLDITSTIDIYYDRYSDLNDYDIDIANTFTTWTRTVVTSKHITILGVIKPEINSLNFKATVTDNTGYNENLVIYYRKRSFTKNCGANQVGTYTSTKSAFSLSSPANASSQAFALAQADADTNLHCDTDIKFEEVEMEDTSFTVSYSLENKSWGCFHDYKPDAIFCTANFLMSFKQTKIYIHNQYNKKGRFYNQLSTETPAKSQIEFVAPNLITKSYHSISWKTQVKIEGIVNEYLTFDTVMIYNHNQCSGEVTVIPHKTTRNAEGVWRFNDFRDLMKSQDSKFLDDKGNVYPDAISSSKSFYKQARFISDYICARLTFNNKEVYTEIVLSDFSINDKPSYR